MENQNEIEKPQLSQTLAGELNEGWDSTARLEQRLESFDILKQRTQEFKEWAYEGGIRNPDKQTIKTFRNLDNCGQYLIFRNYLASMRSRLIGACSCKNHLLCAFCASRRGVKQSMAYREKVQQLEVLANGQLDLVFLTFTVKNGDSLLDRFLHLRSSMQTLLRHRNNQLVGHRKHVTEMFKLQGGVFAYEFKRGANSQTWHPHIHMLALLPKSQKINIQTLKNEWLEITQDSSVINIEYCTNNEPYLEVFAYALKFSEMSHPDRWHAYQLLKGERLISSFGALRGLLIPENENDDVLTTQDPFVDLLFKWYSYRGYVLHAKLTE